MVFGAPGMKTHREHTTSLFFGGVFNKIPEYTGLCNFAKKLRNVFGSTHQGPASMFKKYSKKQEA